MASPSQLDVLVVTATRTEKEEARKVFQKAGCHFTQKTGTHGTNRLDYDEAVWCVGSIAASMNIGLTRLTGTGDEATNTLISKLAIALDIQSKRPVKLTYVAMVGICAGNPYCDRLTCGDIIAVATTVGKKTPDGTQPDVKIVKQNVNIIRAVDSARDLWGTENEGASSDNWVKYLPDDVKGAPSPAVLQQAIKFQLQASSTSAQALYDKLKASLKLPSIVKLTDVEEALDKLCSTPESMVSKVLTQDHVVYSYTGQQPPVETCRCPTIYEEFMIQGQFVRTDFTTKEAWKTLSKETSQRKIAAYDMESYTFASGIEKLTQPESKVNWLVVKSASDIGNDLLKMD